ncbi:MAG: hypothetical protein AB7Q69_13150 [Gemmatimonadales bacterium]
MLRAFLAGSLLALILMAVPKTAAAQYSGRLQATARVVDAQVGWAGLRAARESAARWIAAPGGPAVRQASMSQIELGSLPGTLKDARVLRVTVQYLKN